MKLTVAAPILTAALAPWLEQGAADLPPGLGGTPVVALVRAALERGWQVSVVSLDPAIEQELVARGPQLKIRMGPYRPRHRARDLFAAERRYLAAAIADEGPGVVHAHWTYEFALGALASGRPTVVTAHDRPLRVLRFSPDLYRLARTFMAARVARQADHLTAVSSGVAEHFKRWFGCRGPIAVIPNGLEPEWFAEPRPAAPHDGLTFACAVNGWGALKNSRALLEAFVSVRASLPAARLELYGEGHGPAAEAERWAQQRGLCTAVRFGGPLERSQWRARLRAADVLVHPAREESFSMVLAEAMSSRVPVVAVRSCGGVADTLTDGQQVLLAADGSARALATAMLELGRNAALRQRLAEESRRVAEQRFSASAVLDAYSHVYKVAEGR